MCYGLDYEKTADGVSSDAADWEYAVKKAWDIEESLKKANELAKELKEEAKFTEEEKAYKADYDKELEDAMAQPSESKDETSEKVEEDEDYSAVDRANLDQVIFCHKSEDGKAICDTNGRRILHVLPARINRRLAPATIWANVFAFFLDRNFDRSSSEKITILFDVRAGEGWANPAAITMVKFIRTVTKVLEYNFPERVEKFIIFPVPRLAQGIFNTIKLLFHSSTANKIILVSGPAGNNAPLPKEAIEEHIAGEVLDLTETARLSFTEPRITPKADETSTAPKWRMFRVRQQSAHPNDKPTACTVSEDEKGVEEDKKNGEEEAEDETK
jgi:hypothetical protein